jgi:hypothetical protein
MLNVEATPSQHRQHQAAIQYRNNVGMTATDWRLEGNQSNQSRHGISTTAFNAFYLVCSRTVWGCAARTLAKVSIPARRPIHRLATKNKPHIVEEIPVTWASLPRTL